MGRRRPSFHAELAREQVAAIFAADPIINPVGNEDQDEQGNPRIIVPPGVPAVPYRMGLSTPRSTLYAWRANPECVECRGRVGSPEQGALVITPDRQQRIAHRALCFVKAIEKFNPTFAKEPIPVARRQIRLVDDVRERDTTTETAAVDHRLVPDPVEVAE